MSHTSHMFSGVKEVKIDICLNLNGPSLIYKKHKAYTMIVYFDFLSNSYLPDQANSSNTSQCPKFYKISESFLLKGTSEFSIRVPG